MKKILVLLTLTITGITACQYLPNDVKDFVAQPEHSKLVSQCIDCHTREFLADSVVENEQ